MANDRTWRFSGAALAAAHVLTAFYWSRSNALTEFAANSAWPTFAEYGRAIWTSLHIEPSTLRYLLLAYGFLALVDVILFAFFPRRRQAAMWGLAGLTAFKMVLFFSRYVMMGNYHLMHFLMTAVFFMYGDRREVQRLFLCLLYFVAGLLKWNAEWMSGAALLQPSFLPDQILSVALAYAVVLETFLIWGLLSRTWWVRRATIIQLIAFHLFSWHIVGYFYPLTMLCLLAPVLMDLIREDNIDLKRIPKSAWALTTVLFLFNISPLLAGQDPALEGRFRNLRLNMLDARATCRVMILLEKENEIAMLSPPPERKAMRIKCDPAVITSYLDRYCQALPQKSRLAFALFSKRETDAEFRLVRDEKDYCHVAANP